MKEETQKWAQVVAEWVKANFWRLNQDEAIYINETNGLIRAFRGQGEKSVYLTAGGMPGEWLIQVMESAAEILEMEGYNVTHG